MKHYKKSCGAKKLNAGCVALFGKYRLDPPHTASSEKDAHHEVDQMTITHFFAACIALFFVYIS
jgi:hypothetical protein